ncbi:MAG TPA: response regulator [Polyangiaceae bacterium]|nr:response regulator [Polyangiaceae bacterium]
MDDDPSGLTTLAAALSKDFDVTAAASPELALAALGQASFDVVCSDYQMQGIDGLCLLQLAAERLPHVGCVLVTGSEHYLRGTRAESDHYVLLKPYDPARLIGIIAQLAQVTETKRSIDGRQPSGVRLRK